MGESFDAQKSQIEMLGVERVRYVVSEILSDRNNVVCRMVVIYVRLLVVITKVITLYRRDYCLFSMRSQSSPLHGTCVILRYTGNGCGQTMNHCGQM